MREARWMSWPLFIAVAALVALLVAPSTRWVVVEQLRCQMGRSQHMASLLADLGVRDLPGGRTVARDPGDDEAVRQAALRRPKDIGAQIVLASYDASGRRLAGSEKVPRLRALAELHPARPEAWATLLQYLAQREFRIGREDEQDFMPTTSVGATSYSRRRSSTRGEFAAFLDAATRGAKADPSNAFFPAMRSLALFGMRRDAEALAALHRAATLKHWDDYSLAETESRLRLMHEALGRRGAVPDICIVAATLYPHYAQLRAGARLAVYSAIRAEQGDNRSAGLAIRHDVMRMAGVMRADSRTAIGSLVGAAIASIAASWPGGERPSAASQSESSDARPERNAAAYRSYLSGIGRKDEARWALAQLAAGRQVRAITKDAAPRSVMSGTPIVSLIAKWVLSLVVLSLALWCLVVGVLTAAAAPDTAPRWRLLAPLGVGLVLMLWFAWTHTANARVLAAYISVIGNLSGDASSSSGAGGMSLFTAALARLGVTLLLVGLPIALMGGAALAGAAARKAVWPTIGKTLRGTGLALAVLYALLAVDLARHEDRASAALAQVRKHEGRYMAQIIGREWPPAEPGAPR